MKLTDLFEDQPATRWYHSSIHQYDIEHCRPFTHFGTHKAAIRRLMEAGKVTPDNRITGYLYSVNLTFGRPIRLFDGGDNHWDSPMALIDKIHYNRRINPPLINTDERNHLFDMMHPDSSYSEDAGRDALAQLLISKGLTHFIYKNRKEDVGADSVMILSNRMITNASVEKIDAPFPELWEYSVS